MHLLIAARSSPIALSLNSSHLKLLGCVAQAKLWPVYSEDLIRSAARIEALNHGSGDFNWGTWTCADKTQFTGLAMVITANFLAIAGLGLIPLCHRRIDEGKTY